MLINCVLFSYSRLTKAPRLNKPFSAHLRCFDPIPHGGVTRRYCWYHVVSLPKYRKKVVFGRLRKEIGGVFRELCEPFGLELVEGHALPDHMRMCLSISSTLSVATR